MIILKSTFGYLNTNKSIKHSTFSFMIDWSWFESLQFKAKARNTTTTTLQTIFWCSITKCWRTFGWFQVNKIRLLLHWVLDTRPGWPNRCNCNCSKWVVLLQECSICCENVWRRWTWTTICFNGGTWWYRCRPIVSISMGTWCVNINSHAPCPDASSTLPSRF